MVACFLKAFEAVGRRLGLPPNAPTGRGCSLAVGPEIVIKRSVSIGFEYGGYVEIICREGDAAHDGGKTQTAQTDSNKQDEVYDKIC